MPIHIVRGYAESEKDAVMGEIESVAQKAPPFNARAGRGYIKVKMTSCGKYGWLSTEGYTKINPLTGRRWPRIPPTIAQIMLKAGQQFYPEFRLETVLINFYTASMNSPDKPILGFHQDTSERNKTAPIISLTFGQGTFLIGGKVDAAGRLTPAELKKLDRTLTTNIVLGDGDLLVMHGDERLCFHAAGEVIGDRRINLTGRMVDPISAADKPLIFSMIGMERSQSLLSVEKAEIEKVMIFRQTTDRKNASEILLTDRAGFDMLAATYLKSRNYPSVLIYETSENTTKPYPTRYVGSEENTVNEMLEESDHFLASTNGSDKFMQRAIEYFRATGKEPWIVTIPDVDNDSGEGEDGVIEPPIGQPPEPERPAKSVGLCVISNISDSGSRGLSSTAWHTPDLTRVYIGRGGSQQIMRSPLHNPFIIDGENSREKVIDSFRRESWRQLQLGSGGFYNAIEKIATRLASGKSVELVCHCKPLACHGSTIRNAALWMIKEGLVDSTPDEPTDSDDRLQLGMIGLRWIEGLAPRSELEIESLIDNKHREWYLKLNGKPAKNPVIHVRGAGGVIAGPQVGFDGQLQRYLYREKYHDVIVHGKLPDEAPEGWVETDLPFDPSKFNYLFAQWDEVDPEIGALIAAAGSKALVAYYRLPRIGLPNPIPEFDDPQRHAKYGAAVPPGTHVAVVGSREFKGNWARMAIEQFVNALPASCTLVSGGAKGADTIAEKAADARGLKTLIHNARWVQKKTRLPDGTIDPNFKPKYFPKERTVEFSNERANAGPERNKVIVYESNSLYAFSNGDDSPGTQDAISFSSSEDKLAQVFEREAKKPSPINEDEYGSLDIFYYDFEEGN
ncbi:alpha-ketoglutarate-dependent dioxygenase AlkB [Microcoleus sp. herbarium14]|uniref:alpha-ketoglutarate-dependent dioxygenase AlkB n=1 Tax=Microcoleus sp. herbarium14 TaxID=3055439 RepID=UPI002FD1AC69